MTKSERSYSVAKMAPMDTISAVASKTTLILCTLSLLAPFFSKNRFSMKSFLGALAFGVASCLATVPFDLPKEIFTDVNKGDVPVVNVIADRASFLRSPALAGTEYKCRRFQV